MMLLISVIGTRVNQYTLNDNMPDGDYMQYFVETDIDYDKIGYCDYIDGELIYNHAYKLIDQQNALRERRNNECFPIINRGTLWYEMLNNEQKQELRVWYQAWLDAPATLVVPEKPEWIQNL